MPEKCIEKACADGISVLEARRQEGDVLLLRVKGRDAPALAELAQRYSMRIVSDRAVGPDLYGLLCAARPFMMGVALCVALLWPLSAKVWLIDVQCPEGGEIASVKAALEREGIRQGCAFPQVDPLARRLESLCPGFAHISVRRDGAALLVDAYRETPAPEVYDVAAARDLVSGYDAVVEEIVVLAGRAAVQPGDVVRRGQTLILGEEKATDESTRGVRALGEATGRVWAYGEAEADGTEHVKAYTGRERVRAKLRLFGWTIPLRSAEDFQEQETAFERVAVGGMLLPLHIERETLREVEWKAVKADENAQKAALEACAMADAISKLPENAQIIDKWTDYSMMEGDRSTVRVCVQARLPIAVAREQAAAGDIP